MSEQQHKGHVPGAMSVEQMIVKESSAPPETGATVPPHPQMYDIARDEMRHVAQEDYDAAACVAEEGQLRNLLVRKLLNMDRDKLRAVRKLIDDNFPPR